MKTKAIFLFAVICVAFSIYSYTLQNKKNALSALSLMNVEALANGEIGSAMCLGEGSVDCPNHYAKVLYYQ
ncbi:MAG: NVEALA domain-containing protein [Bacteroides sp.]|uniref:NVEALA domain-containing protein n=1 Tax=Bacteroides sp. TaxID=29523 RepID=UPI002FCB4EBA|nr:hypothetical protein [Bacteroides sp.]